MSVFRVNVADLLRHPGARRPVHLEAPIGGLEISGSRVPFERLITADLHLESVSDGILAMGHVRGRWVAECSRCLADLDCDFDLELRELFEHQPPDDETYPLAGEELDLEPALRDAILVELPLAPVCIVDCQGLCPECGADRNLGDCGHVQITSDPRWQGLADFQFHDHNWADLQFHDHN